MRQVVALSLPPQDTKFLKTATKERGFQSVSSFVQYLLAAERDIISEENLLKTVRAARREYKTGKALRTSSLADLV